MFSIKQLAPKIYHIRVDKLYDLCMMFLRYQETYESSNPLFVDRQFTIVELMAWYTKVFCNGAPTFTYTDDWYGFNMPMRIIKEVHDRGITDPNMYDSLMIGLYGMINSVEQDAYIIGTTPESDCYDHEITHAMYYVNHEYKSRVNMIINKHESYVIDDVRDALKCAGYAPHVLNDEINAYGTTGWSGVLDEFDKTQPWLELVKELKTLHKEYFPAQESLESTI